MGASVFVEWPEITTETQDAAPGFRNDCKAWAAWLANTVGSRRACKTLRKLGLDALLSHNTDGLSARKIDWRSPHDLLSSARTLRSLVAAGDPRVKILVETYAEGANQVDPARDEFCIDLEDVAEIAEYAASHGAQRMTLGYYW